VTERACVHVTGPEGSGKTTLVEAILGAFDGPTITVRCRRDDDLDESIESAPARDAELAIGLVDLPLPTLMPPGAEWVEAYRLWLGRR
jgi:ABC-type lipoprotein export system ATPase subunit